MNHSVLRCLWAPFPLVGLVRVGGMGVVRGKIKGANVSWSAYTQKYIQHVPGCPFDCFWTRNKGNEDLFSKQCWWSSLDLKVWVNTHTRTHIHTACLILFEIMLWIRGLLLNNNEVLHCNTCWMIRQWHGAGGNVHLLLYCLNRRYDRNVQENKVQPFPQPSN